MRYYFFFFQAEDGIRDIGVTGVQTCALPISGVLLVPQDLAGGRCDLALGQDAGGHLVQQRLEQVVAGLADDGDVDRDRKSTRLNSSHANISYAVFCLKKKKLSSAYTSHCSFL